MTDKIDIFYNKFKSSIGKFFINKKPDVIATGLSGGADSSALTLLLSRWSKENNVKLKGIIVNHNLRPESKEEALSVKEDMKRYGIESEVLEYTGEIPTSNIEEIARNYRYDLITEYCKNNNIKYVAIGHNKDEQYETFILNLTRGSGIYGLCGISDTAERDNITFIRPMLDFTKDELKEVCKIYGYNWVEDPSNYDDKYKRVKIRKLRGVLEDLGLTTDRIINTISNLKKSREAIEFYTEEAIKDVITERFDKLNLIEISLDRLIDNPDEIIYRCLTKIMNSLQTSVNDNKGYKHIRAESIDKLTDKIKEAKYTGELSDITIGNYRIKQIKKTGKIQIMYIK